MTLVRAPYDHRIFRYEILWAVRGWIRGENWGRQETIYWLENFLLFIPFGLLFPNKESWIRVVIIAATFSAFIEICQFIFVLGECELDDVIANTIGALTGYFLFKTLKKIYKKRRGESSVKR